eukprot:13027497-Alexandrium_andersonii.AAC.1
MGSVAGVSSPCGLCGAAIAATVGVCPACAAAVRVIRALGFRGRALDVARRDLITRSLLFVGDVVENLA